MALVDRRQVLTRMWRWLGALAALQFVGVVAAFLWPRKRMADDAAAIVEAGPVGDFSPASVTPFPAGQFYLLRLSDGGFLAVSSRCPHLGCTVLWDDKTRSFPCPCHASKFDLHGDVISPPAPRALDLFRVTIEGGVVRVDTSARTERARFDRSQVVYL
jgi:cytochrome b6-f complex iron-sulfur subunit